MLTLKQVSQILNCEFTGADVKLTAINMDSRKIKPGELFIAMKGELVDGHDFIQEAVAKGAVAVIAENSIQTSVPILKVKDSLAAFGQLAAFHRAQFDIPVLAVTGSCGKTSTKTMLASIMSQCGTVLFPQASYNNAFGLPLTLFRLCKEHQYAVLEVGANHIGEISALIQLAKPTVAAITNIGPVHLEGFGNIEGVAKAKAEIFEGLDKNGIAIINADDDFKEFLIKKVEGKHRYITFGLSDQADVQGQAVRTDDEGHAHFILQIENTHSPIKLPTLGEHHVMNALAAAAAAHAIGVPLSAIKQGLELAPLVDKRLISRVGIAGTKVIDDTYNANLPAAKAALKVLAQAKGKKVFVFGGMAELGTASQMHHQQLGEYARSLAIDQVFATGQYGNATVQAFGVGAQYFENKQLMIDALTKILDSDMTVLVKGSRSARMEEVVKAIVVD